MSYYYQELSGAPLTLTAYLTVWSVGFRPLLIDGLFTLLGNSKAAVRFSGSAGVLAYC